VKQFHHQTFDAPSKPSAVLVSIGTLPSEQLVEPAWPPKLPPAQASNVVLLEPGLLEPVWPPMLLPAQVSSVVLLLLALLAIPVIAAKERPTAV
jgi:hypothetical protein